MPSFALCSQNPRLCEGTCLKAASFAATLRLSFCVCVDTRGRSRASDEMFGLVDREIERKNGRGGRATGGKAVAWIASVGCLMNTSEDTRTRIGKGGTRRCRVACEMRCNCGCGKGER